MQVMEQLVGKVIAQSQTQKDLRTKSLDSQTSTLAKVTPSSDKQVVASTNKFTGDDVVKLSKALSACQLVQRTYGKQADDIGKITEVFVRILKEYEPDQVIEAVKEWVTTSAEFPTPSDIANILSPKPRFDYAVYQSLQEQKRSGATLSDLQWKYLREYEERAMKGR